MFVKGNISVVSLLVSKKEKRLALSKKQRHIFHFQRMDVRDKPRLA